jgi:hypothetical protein
LQEKGLRVVPLAADIGTQGDHGATFGAVRAGQGWVERWLPSAS